jgi:hypothetical protein
LFERYRNYWETQIEGVRLINFYARHRLTGGHHGVRRRLYGQNRYYPYLLTEPGAVFLLAGGDSDADSQRLAEYVNSGLPAVRPSQAVELLTWRTCPYLPENGYGTIVVNPITPDRWQALTTGLISEAETGGLV